MRRTNHARRVLRHQVTKPGVEERQIWQLSDAEIDGKNIGLTQRISKNLDYDNGDHD